MTKLKLGYSIGYTFEQNYKTTKKFNCVQIMFDKISFNSNEIEQIKLLLVNYKYIYIHSSYQINIGSDLLPSQTDLYNSSLDLLLKQIELSSKLNAKGIVLHMGKNVSNKHDAILVYNNMIKFIIELFKKINKLKYNIPILLETSSGQGGEMCSNIKEFVNFIQTFSKQKFYKQIGICIDTCHMFQAGLDFNNDILIKQVHTILEPVKHKIKLIHLNDSYYPVGSHIDRHAQIGKGYIKTSQLLKFIYPYKSIHMILETKGPYEEQIKLLKL